MDDGGWETDEKQIRRAFVEHFRAVYSKGPCAKLGQFISPEVLSLIPSVPDIARAQFDQQPSDLEIRGVAMSLGPDKAPGPDGFNGKMVQENWDVFGPIVTKEVQRFFQTGQMRSDIARSNLVLIPKNEDAKRVSEFRPISVCNYLYKVISKILANRMRPYIHLCVSNCQTAFIPGREISENVIILREVLHSFKTKNCTNQEFCLKLDLSKAFDRMDWGYLSDLLPLYGFPAKFCAWIMACVQSAEFSIVINGRGDGFLKASSGLRQGCALSPYLFILGMDLLSRQLQFMAGNNQIQGVRLARSAPKLTNCLYADDLLLFGSATRMEATAFAKVLAEFTAVSGQRIGTDKSTIWFSNASSEEQRAEVSQILMVQSEEGSNRYLGAPISTGAASFDFLIERVASRLSNWKSCLLSPAGRTVLIKAVLQALPVYFMATTKLPSRVIQKLTSIITKFYWGKTQKDRYLAYISWERMAVPVGMGGLGFKELGAMNQAMLMKFLWKLASESDSQWVALLRAKYLPRSHLWHSKRTYRCTIFWRSLMSLRPTLLPLVIWKVGDGLKCNAFAQPWFQEAVAVSPANQMQRNTKLSDLIQESGDGWDAGKLMQLFGYVHCMTILGSVCPPTSSAGQDRLIFTKNTNGDYSVKKGYAAIRDCSQIGDTSRGDIWKAVWNKGNVLPRVRHFIWKLLQKALPLMAILASKMSSIDPICATCIHQPEDAIHFLFHCPFSRACWFASPIPIRTDALHGDLDGILRDLSASLTDIQWTDMANVMWALWRCRNDKIYGGKTPTVEEFRKYLHSISVESMVASSKHYVLPDPQDLQDHSQSEFCCHVDGSWTQQWEGGYGCVITKGDALMAYKVGHVKASCAFQAEAEALKQGIRLAQQLGTQSCTFYSDSESLVKLVSQMVPPTDADWRAFREVYDAWEVLKMCGRFKIAHISRSHNGLADHLAKKGRLLKTEYIGYSYPLFGQ